MTKRKEGFQEAENKRFETIKTRFVDVYKLANYDLSETAKRLKTARCTLVDLIDNDPRLAAQKGELDNDELDKVERALYARAMGGKSDTAILAILNNRRPDRWSQRQEMTIRQSFTPPALEGQGGAIAPVLRMVAGGAAAGVPDVPADEGKASAPTGKGKAK